MIPVELMVPMTAARLPTGDRYAHEPKWDGYQAAVVVLGDAQIMSRRGTDLTDIFPDLAASPSRVACRRLAAAAADHPLHHRQRHGGGMDGVSPQWGIEGIL